MLSYRNVLIVSWLFAVFILGAIAWRYNQQKSQEVNNKPAYRYIPGQPSKCFDCEASLPSEYKYLGQPSKCFDCEPGSPHPEYEHPVKVFSAETPLFTTSAYRRTSPF